MSSARSRSSRGEPRGPKNSRPPGACARLRALMAKAPKAPGANGKSDVTDVIARLEAALPAVGDGYCIMNEGEFVMGNG